MRLVTWNIQWGLGMDGRVDLPRIVREVRAMADFDVLCLQEVAQNFPGLRGSAGEDQPAILAAELPGFEAYFGVATDITDGSGGRRRFGNMLLSRLPVLQRFTHALPWPSDPTCPSMARVALEAVVQTPSGPVRVMTTHLEYYSVSIRMTQVAALRQLQAEACRHAAHPRRDGRPGDPFERVPRPVSAILCGDMNFRPGSPEHGALTVPLADGLPGWHDAWVHANRGMPCPPTFRVDVPDAAPYCCDFCFVSADLLAQVRRVAVDVETRASDHQPMLLELA